MWAKLNTGTRANGEFKAWLDGSQVLHRRNIRYRYNTNFDISRTYMTTYAGGSTVSNFAPNQDQFIWFDDFETWVGGGTSPCRLTSRPTSPPARNPPPTNPPPASPPPSPPPPPPTSNPPPQDQCPTGCVAAPAEDPAPNDVPMQQGVGTRGAPRGVLRPLRLWLMIHQ